MRNASPSDDFAVSELEAAIEEHRHPHEAIEL
jgi:hypothetical protein